VANQARGRDGLIAAGCFPRMCRVALATSEPAQAKKVTATRKFRVSFAGPRGMASACPAGQLSSPGPRTCFGTSANHYQQAAPALTPRSRSQR
jgi:hypothetical protein